MKQADTGARRVRVRALAKINLDLRVLGKRPDGYHELRTIFQTISLSDSLEIAFTPGSKTSIELDDPLAIADNLVERAARLVMEQRGPRGRVALRLSKRIPMGAGLGGGSSDAAAVLLALPVLTGRVPGLPQLMQWGAQLGSDVPFFLMGGRALGIGRGTELFPLPDLPALPGIVVAPGIHVSTARAYQDLSPRLTTESQENKIFSFQNQCWGEPCGDAPANDFEAVVFEQESRLAQLKKRIVRAGASHAMMSGSGSSLFGLFTDRDGVKQALKQLETETVLRMSLVSRTRYRAMWWRALAEHQAGRVWPPQSRHAR